MTQRRFIISFILAFSLLALPVLTFASNDMTEKHDTAKDAKPVIEERTTKDQLSSTTVKPKTVSRVPFYKHAYATWYHLDLQLLLKG